MKQFEPTRDGKTSLVLSFFLLDIVESLHQISIKELEKAGGRENAKVKSLFNNLKWDINDLRKITTKLEEHEQILFGEMSDAIKEVVVLFFDRANDKADNMKDVIDNLKDKESLRQINVKRFIN